ncbi:MAG: hypothetical protein IT330_01695 [Anaerolineae bacterium]|nr:hypothetical protein [Anaerolineae bacterium]
MTGDDRLDNGGEVPYAELVRRGDAARRAARGKPGRAGRPPKPTRRQPSTLHLTDAEREELGHLQATLQRYFAANRSEVAGVAVSVLAGLVEEARAAGLLTASDLEDFRSWMLERAHL